jgi:hypothetical protein
MCAELNLTRASVVSVDNGNCCVFVVIDDMPLWYINSWKGASTVSDNALCDIPQNFLYIAVKRSVLILWRSNRRFMIPSKVRSTYYLLWNSTIWLMWYEEGVTTLKYCTLHRTSPALIGIKINEKLYPTRLISWKASLSPSKCWKTVLMF